MFSVKQWPIQCVETNTRSPKHLNKHFTKQHKLLVSWLAMVTEALQWRVGYGSKGSDYPAVFEVDKQRFWCWLKLWMIWTIKRLWSRDVTTNQQPSTQEQALGCLLSDERLTCDWSVRACVLDCVSAGPQAGCRLSGRWPAGYLTHRCFCNTIISNQLCCKSITIYDMSKKNRV